MLSLDVLPWNSNFELGFKGIDDQHKELVGLINELCSRLIEGDESVITDAYQKVVKYANFHFNFEEAFWRKRIGVDDWVTEHSENHSLFLPEAEKILQNQSHQQISEAIEEVVLFLVKWLVLHILGEDKKMSLVINALEKGHSLTGAKQLAAIEAKNSLDILTNVLLNMHQTLASQSIELQRERIARAKAENQLLLTNRELQKANQALSRQAIIDELTQIENRRSFQAYSALELRRCVREKSHLAFILIDIDHFKQLNDTYGHDKGDKVLQQVASCLEAQCLRPGDKVFRIGGEEFCFITSNQNLMQVKEFSEKVRLAVLALQIENRNSSVGNILTISGGIGMGIPEPNATTDEILKTADLNLYKAKDRGRNQIVG